MTTAGDLGWGDPGATNYRRDHIVTITVEGIALAVRRELAPIFRGFITELVSVLGYPVDKVRDDWGYAYRCIRGTGPGTSRPCVLSNHSWGTAIDVNATTNPMTEDGRVHTDLPPAVHQLAARWGLRWGGDYSGARKDAMHFEAMMRPADVGHFPLGPKVPPAPAPVQHGPRIAITTAHLEGKPVARITIEVPTDDQGQGYIGPDEGLHLPFARVLGTSVEAPLYPPRDGRYGALPRTGPQELAGETVIFVQGADPHTTANVIVCASDG